MLLPATASSKAHSVNDMVFFMVFLLFGADRGKVGGP
jgi:hypothetical protein